MITASGPARRRHLASLSVGLAAALVLAQAHTAAQNRPFGWKISGPQGSIYLVGSVHLLTQDAYPLHAALENAYKDSSHLVEEVDFAEMASAQFATLSRGMQPSSTPLEKVLTPATMTLLNTKASELGLPMEALKRFKPWMIALTVEALEWQKAGFDADLGLDKHFYDQAKQDGKTVQGLETVEYQISRFDEMPLEVQDRLLSETLKSIDTEQANTTKLIDAWKSGNVAVIERIVLKDLKEEPMLYQRLLVERNKNWMPKLEALFGRGGRSLVVVGAAHLIGPDGLLTMLKARGYKVEQLGS